VCARVALTVVAITVSLTAFAAVLYTRGITDREISHAYLSTNPSRPSSCWKTASAPSSSQRSPPRPATARGSSTPPPGASFRPRTSSH
jgi:hypothetical protein